MSIEIVKQEKLMLEYLLKKFNGYSHTCSITNVKDGCVSFIRNKKYESFLEMIENDCWIIISKKINPFYKSNKVKLLVVDDPDYIFTLYHNEINRNKTKSEVVIGENCKIHSTVILDVDGLKVVNTPDGRKIQFIHTGKVEIGNNVEIGPYTIIHRGTLDSTIIKNGVKIGAHNNIGHNNVIGENTVFAVGAITNGSVQIGNNCWIGSGSLIRNGISICANSVIGLGAVVVKDIKTPGIYMGNPAKFFKPKPKEWNF